MHVQLSLSLNFYLFYLFLNSCDGNDAFSRSSTLVKVKLEIPDFIMCILYKHLSATPVAVTSDLKQRFIG